MKTGKNTFKRTAFLLLAVMMTILCAACHNKQGSAENGASKPGEDLLSAWTENAQAKTALICFQKAEVFLYNMVKDGNVMYKKSLLAAIDGQQKARAKLTNDLPAKEWTFDS